MAWGVPYISFPKSLVLWGSVELTCLGWKKCALALVISPQLGSRTTMGLKSVPVWEEPFQEPAGGTPRSVGMIGQVGACWVTWVGRGISNC